MSRRKQLELFDEDTMKTAVLNVVEHGLSIRSVARHSNLSYATLRKYVVKYNNTEKKKRNSIRFFPNYEVNQVYSKELEDILEKYLLTARKLHYGLTSETVKKMSYDLAIKNKLKVPKSWTENKMAGKHWLYGYLKRHPGISDILSWSRKFRPPIKNQFNTTVEIANPSIEEITLSEKDLEVDVMDEQRVLPDEPVDNVESSFLKAVDVMDKRRVLPDKSVDNVESSFLKAVRRELKSFPGESHPSCIESVFEDSTPLCDEQVENSRPVIINVLKKPKKKL